MDQFMKFVQIINHHGLDPKSSVAMQLFEALNLLFTPAPDSIPDEYALMELRAKLTATSVHDQLVGKALASDAIIKFLNSGKKIQAIKELRLTTGCSLKEAKDAIEDSRVRDLYNTTTYGF